ncbi:MAG: hypothetical protein R3E32_14740 [Chitinophagales bacterium]
MNLIHLFFLVWTSLYGDASLNSHLQLCQHLHEEDQNPADMGELAMEELKPEKVLNWSHNQKLVWADFQGDPHPKYPHIAALTYSSIVYKYHCENGALNIDVEANFRINDSWVRPEAMNEYYLNHEQLHFDITELYARKFREAVGNRLFTCDQVDDFEVIADRVLDAWRLMEQKYDLETHFSHDLEMQREWYVYIHSQMVDYKAYAMVE